MSQEEKKLQNEKIQNKELEQVNGGNKGVGIDYCPYCHKPFQELSGMYEHKKVCPMRPEGADSEGISCIPETALVTLSDGSRVPVSRIREGDRVLALDHMTGEIKPCQVVIVVNHHEVSVPRRVTVLTFDDGRETSFIEEHGYLDLTTRRYEYMRPETAKGFIGHAFAFAENGTVTAHRLTAVTDHIQKTRAYEIVTEDAVDFVADGAVSCTQLTDVLLNMFPLAPDSLRYDTERVEEAVRKHGYTAHEDYPMIPEALFSACRCRYLKAAMATGGISPDAFDALLDLFDRECRSA